MYLIVIAIYVAIVVLLQFKKSRQAGSKKAKKVAFFHPFWYSEFYLVMMEEVDKKSCGH